MDAENVEVEMKELSPAEVQEDKDAEKGKTEGTKEAEKEAKEEKKEKEKEVKEEGNVYSKLNEEAEQKAVEKEDKEKEIKEEGNVYCKLKKPSEDIYNPTTSTSAPKPNKEAEKKAEEKEIKEEEGNVYCKLKTPTEDIYNPSMPSSSRKSTKAEKEEEKENEDEEGDETNVYCKLNNPSENVYMSTTSSTPKHKKDIHRQVVYKKVSAVFIILSVILLIVVLALVLKSQPAAQEVDSSQICTNVPSVERKPNFVKPQFSVCGRGWRKYKKSCYYISKERLTWQRSTQACQKKGGDLVVIDSADEQRYLNSNFTMMYWIGLRYSEQQKWMWIDNTSLTQSYWGNGEPKSPSQDSCALLRARESDTKNWITNPCRALSHFICQKG